jgi:Ca2+-binding EF-hand superfamily protein
MQKTVVIVAVGGIAGAVAIGALLTRGGAPDVGLRPVVADVDAAPEPPRITATSPASRAPIGTAIAPSSGAAPENPRGADLAVPDRVAGDGDDVEDRPRRGERDWRSRERLSPEEFAERFQSRRDRFSRMMARYDADGDGVLSEAEREELRRSMRATWQERMIERMTPRFDADGDGVLSDDERLEAEAEMEARAMEWRIRMQERFDTDGDGQISDDEQRAAQQQFRRGGPQSPEMIQRYDRDGDGELNLDESYAAYLERFDQRQRQQFVSEYDLDADGSVDATDLESFLTRYRESDPATDVNGDGVLNQMDVDQFRDLMMTQPSDAEPFPPGRGDGSGFWRGRGRPPRDSQPAPAQDTP